MEKEKGIEPDKFYTVKEVAELLRVKCRTIYYLIAIGELRAVKVAKFWRIRGEELIRFIEENDSYNF